MERTRAPIALFVYNRPHHLRQTIEALQKNELALESDLFIFSDGAKNPEQIKSVNEVREYIKTIAGFKSITIEESPSNKGLANSIIYGVTKIVNQFGKIIVLEDDLLVSPEFLSFLNDGLAFYQDTKNVGMIHGHIYTINNLPPLFFSYKVGCLGWGTWSDRWQKVNFDGQYLLDEIIKKKLQRRFDLNNSYPYLKMLKDQITGKNSSWAIRVYASFLLNELLVFYPGKSYVQHIGYDSGTHCNGATIANDLDGRIEETLPKARYIIPINNDTATTQIEDFYRVVLKKPFLFVRILKRIIAYVK